MAVGKEDYKNSQVREKRRIKVPKVTLAKVELDNDDKRTRAELLDSIEELFQNTYHAGRKLKYDKDVDLDSLKAILTMLVLSAANNSDDIIGATQAQVDAINLNSTNIARNASDLATFISNISISNNKVGIGTTSPSQKLDVNGNMIADTYYVANTSNYIDISTGLRLRSNSDGIRFMPNGTDTVKFLANGNVGIGTTSPGKRLDIRTNGVGDGITLTTSTPKTFAQIINGNSETFPYGKFTMNYGDTTPVQIVALSNMLQLSGGVDTTSGKISFRIATSERMRLTDTGLGIGTTSPAYKLDVNGGGVRLSSSNFHVYYGSYTGSWARGYLIQNSDASDQYGITGEFDNDSFEGLRIGKYVYDNKGIFIEKDGNVGIGTTGPEAKLTIKSDPGDTNQPTRITNSSTDAHTGLFLNGTGNATSEKYGMQFGGYNEYSIGGIFGVLDSTGGSTSGDITIDFANGTSAGALIEKVRFTHEGNVGIGTETPSEKLEVAGNIKVGDGDRIKLGDSDDLEILHSADGYITNNSGTFYIQTLQDDGDIIFRSDDGSGGVAEYFRVDGGDELVLFSKEVRLNDSVGLKLGNFGDLHMYHDGSNSYIRQVSSGNLYIDQLVDDSDIILRSDNGSGGIAEYFRIDGSAVANKFSEKVQIYKVDATANPRLSIGRQAQESINFDVEDRTARIYHRQDETTGDHVLKLTVDSDTSDNKKIHLGFRDADGSNESTKFTINQDGNVGIGTTAPSEKLHVAGNIKLSGNLDIGGSLQKQIQVFPMNFVDDLGTAKHFMPFVTANEQTVNYQEEAAMVMPADGRVVSVTVHYAQMHGAASDITVGIETSPCGQSYTNAWTIEETETISASADDDHHVFHFAFDNAKHFESTDKMALSIQQSVDLQNANRFFWVTAVIEYDWSTFLGGTSAEHGTTP
jgi:hypothetical protein